MTLVVALLLQARRADKSPGGDQLAEERHDTIREDLREGFKSLRDTMNTNHRVTEKAARLRHRRTIQQIVAVPDETLRLYQDAAKRLGEQERSA